MSDYYIGIMTGTSVDAVDAVLCRISQTGNVAHQYSHSEAFPPSLSERLHQAMTVEVGNLLTFKQLEHDYSAHVAVAVNHLLALAEVPAEHVISIGCHGQTLWHHPPSVAASNNHAPFSLQLINPALIAVNTGIAVISDFRQKDIMAGGEGAPLVPAFHYHTLAAQCPPHTAILNLGGIANITYLGAGKEDVIGFDTGPANTLLDLAYRQHFGAPGFDKDGEQAAQGKVLPTVLQRLLDDPYFKKPPPKSTGREYFSENWLRSRLKGKDDSSDLLRTLTEFSVDSIVQSLRFLPHQPPLIVACGGGIKNQLLMQQLRGKLAPAQVVTTADYGIDPQAVEAMAFAWLAWCYDQRLPGNLSAVTGARQAVILGAKTYAD